MALERLGKTRESSVQDYLIAEVHRHGGKAVKLVADSSNGEPDVLLSGPWWSCSQMMLVEVKREGELPTDLQQARAAEWRAAGARVAWIDRKSLVGRLLAVGEGLPWPT